jgi:predicted MPP superfamily phosphohydrolase
LKWVGGAAALGVALPAEARFVEPYALEVTRHEVPLPDLPAALDGFRIVHLTDLHCGPVTPERVLRDAVGIAGRLRPDAVMLTGDFVHRGTDSARGVADLLAPLRPPHGMWGCLGNHDYGARGAAGAITALLRARADVRVLRNGAEEMAPGLWVAGIEDTLRGRPRPDLALCRVPEGAPAVFLTHNPVGVFACTSRPWLALAGHTHGGQIRIPGIPPRFPPGMAGFPYIAGWGVFDHARLYISRGVGMGMFPLRFRCRPEIAVMTLRRGDGPPQRRPGLTDRAVRGVGRVVRAAVGGWAQ